MKNYLLLAVLAIFTSCVNSIEEKMTAHQQSPAGGTFYTFNGKIIGQDSLRWDIDLDNDSSPDIFAFKERQNLNLALNDIVAGDDFNGHYIIRSKK